MLTPRSISRIAPHALLSPPSWGDHPGDSSDRIAEGCGGGESCAGYHAGDGSQQDRSTEDRHQGGLDGRNVDRGGRVEGGEVSPSRREAQDENANPVEEEDVEECVNEGHHGLQHVMAEDAPVEPPGMEELEKVMGETALWLDPESLDFEGFPDIDFDEND